MQAVLHLIEQFIPEHYDVSLTIDRERRSFSGTVSIEGVSVPDATDIRLHAKDLAIESVTYDGKRGDFSLGDNDELIIRHDTHTSGKHLITIVYSGKITDSLHGLYPCYYDLNGTKKELLVTQLESHHAREVFPCVDEPAAKASYDLSLTTEQGVNVLGNMPVKLQREESSRLLTVFERTPRMSSYLVAFVIGELQSKSARTKNDVEVTTWCTPAQPLAALDFALAYAVKTIEFFDDYFGVPYPLPKCDHVAVPDFSAGAMENWGLIVYREVALLADPKTTSITTKQYIAEVIAHELSHQWFGNLVTMKWWDNLWLNESFATVMAYVAMDALYPEWNVWLDFAYQESLQALRRDALDGVQPVQIAVNHPDEINAVFDSAIVYAKGARLIRMLEQYVGRRAFQAGLKQYFETFAYQNTEAGDLWTAFGAASKQPVSKLMDAWITQPGYPIVHISHTGLRQQQFFIGPHVPSARLWPIPLGASSAEDVPALLETRELAMPMTPGERLNVGDSAHFITQYDPTFLRALTDELWSNETSALDRLQLLHEATLFARGGMSASAELIPLVRAYQPETSEPVWNIIALTVSELKKFVETDEAAEAKLRQLSTDLAKAQYQRLGHSLVKNEPESDTKLRSIIFDLMAYGEDEDVIATAQTMFTDNSLEDLDPELRASIISVVVRHTQTKDTVTDLLKKYQQTSSSEIRDDIAIGITSTRDPDMITLLLKTLTDANVVRSQDAFRWFAYLIRSRYSREATWQWLQNNWSWVEKTFRYDMHFDSFPRYAAAGLRTPRQLAEYRAFFEPLQSIPALERTISLGIAEIEGRIELLERDGDAVRNVLINE